MNSNPYVQRIIVDGHIQEMCRVAERERLARRVRLGRRIEIGRLTAFGVARHRASRLAHLAVLAFGRGTSGRLAGA